MRFAHPTPLDISDLFNLRHFGKKLNTYKLGIIKATQPMNLDRLEDYYVEATKADLSLNRYKVTTH